MHERRMTITRPAAFLIIVSLSACGDLKNGLADSKRSQTDIKSELGVSSEVNFREFTGTKGKTTTVTVHLDTVPPGDVAAIKASVTAIVTRDFRSHVDNVIISF